MELEDFNGKTNIRQFELSADDAFDACCGKVLITRQRVLVMYCTFCQKKFSCFDDFVDHLSTEHYYQSTEEEDMFTERINNEAELKYPCSPFGNRQEDDEYFEFSQIQRFDEVVIKPDFKEIQEEYFAEIEEVIINNGAYCSEEPVDCKQVKSNETREQLDKEIQTDVVLNMEGMIVDDFDVRTKISKTVGDFDTQRIHDKENYNMDKHYRQYEFKGKLQKEPSTTQKIRQGKYKKHATVKVHKCNICNKEFLFKERLKKHYIIHSEERKYKCHICNFAFKDNSNLRAHLKRHTKQKKISCDTCSKKFFTRSEARQHERYHTGERPYVCSTCGFAFTTSGALTLHAKRHNSEPTYKCNHCIKGFYARADLRDHMLVHTKEKPFVCHICGASFPRYKSMLRHTKLHAKAS